MSWEEVQALRKAGKFAQAIELAVSLLNPGADRRIRTQLDWSWYGLIKERVLAIRAKLQASEPISPRDTAALIEALRGYARQPAIRPDNALANILREVSKVAAHLPQFPGFIRWVGIDGLALEDWQYQERDGKVFRPVALSAARALAKWVKANPEASLAEVELAHEWLDRIRPAARGDDALWVEWDRALMLRRLGQHRLAAETLGSVLKAKRGEFWVWAEAARLYAEEQPDLALACFCRALACGAEGKFTVKVHREFAELLVEQQDYAQASREVAQAVDIRQQEGWGLDAPLQALVDSAWYDPMAPSSQSAQAFYAEHAGDALVLCFDHVDERPANYLGKLVPHVPKDAPPHRKVRPLPRFAVLDDKGMPMTLLGPGLRNLDFKLGAPLNVIVARQEGSSRETIVQVTPRPTGEAWDCTRTGEGVVVREASPDHSLRVFTGRDSEDADAADAWSGGEPARLGQGVRFRWARNPKSGRSEIFSLEPGPLPDKDIKCITGRLRRQPAGHAFVDDAFVPPPLVRQLGEDVDEVAALLVYARHPKKDNEYSWRAVTLSAA